MALDTGAPVVAPRTQAVFLRALVMHTRRDTLAASTPYQYRCDLQWRGHRWLARQPTNPHGRRSQRREATLQDHLFRVLDDATVRPTKNASEQAIRRRTGGALPGDETSLPPCARS